MLLGRFSKKMQNALLVLSSAAITLLIPGSVWAQVVGATLLGTVTDTSGAVIPNAKVSIQNTATRVTRDITTDSAGFYTAPNLLPGSYGITTTVTGFATNVHTGVVLTVGAQRVLNISLQVGQLSQTVEVSTEALTVQLANSNLGAVVNSTTVRELPLNGRSWTDLATLQPGVNAIQTQASFEVGSVRGNRGFGAQITVAGARPQQNNYRLDGISLNDFANGGPGSVLGGNLGVDAIQEFSVLTSNYSAEYGKTAGGVVNAITRSGTNQFHGGAYEFLRNSALDARNFFDGPTIPPFKRNEFGVDAGGPIRKDKVFIFGDYEGIRQSKGITNVDTVPSDAARSGFVHITPPTPVPSACVSAALASDPTAYQCTVDPSVQKYLPFWPVANGGIKAGTNGDIGIFTFAGQQVISENFFTIRVDDKISDKDTLSGTYLRDVTPYYAPDALDAMLFNSKTSRQVAALEETHTFGSTLVDSVRIGYNRAHVVNNLDASAINPLGRDPSLGAVPGTFASRVTTTGLTPFLGGIGGGGGTYLYVWNSFQGYDDAFWTHGAHALKFGGAVERMDSNDSKPSGSSGLFTFNNLPDFLVNLPNRFTSLLGASTPRGLRQTLFGLYAQDDWRVRPNLTVNLGLRWEMTTVPTEVQGKLATLTHLTDPSPHLGSPFFSNPTLRNFDPRVGFAWDPFRNGKTALRGGFGIFDVLPLIYQFLDSQINDDFPFTINGSTGKLPPRSFYTGAAALLGQASLSENNVEQHAHRDYIMQWNLNLQRELAPNLTALVGYVGSRGVHQPFRVDDADVVLPTKTPFGYLYPSPVGSGTTLNPNFGDIVGMFYEGNSFYDALQLGVQKAMSHGVQLQVSFTWGKSIDTGSASGHGDQFSNSISSLPWYDLKGVRSLSDFNVGRTLVISGTWQVPSPKWLSGPATWITNGWELGGIYKVNDGVPFTPTWGTDGDPQGLNSSDPYAFLDRLGGPGCATLTNPGNPNNYIKTQCFSIPSAPNMAFWTANCDPAPPGTAGVHFPQCFNLRGNAGRNILIGPGTSNLDFSLFKNNRIKRVSENFNVQFRAEFFNVLNHANFALPVTPNNTDIFDSTGTPTGVAGLITSTATTAREIQFALKLIW